MCLIINKEETNKIKAMFAKSKGQLAMYKIVDMVDNVTTQGRKKQLISIHRELEYIPGWNKSSRPLIWLTDNEKHAGVINAGIHVYTTLAQAQRFSAYMSEVLLPVMVEEKDFVMGGKNNEAVFMKVFVKQSIYDKIMNGRLPHINASQP
jgi:hypothetical protein